MAATPRSYRSALRDEQARHTRVRIVDAATALFVANGYGATSIDAIAAAAGVSRKTVFDAVGEKVQLVKLAYDYAIVGDDAPIPLLQRQVIADIEAEANPARKLAMYAALVTDVGARIAPVWRVLEGAAGTDAAARRLHEHLLAQRRDSMWIPASRLAADGALRPGLGVKEAADLLWLLNDPALYDKLVRQCGWTEHRFREWLAETLQTQLLAPP